MPESEIESRHGNVEEDEPNPWELYHRERKAAKLAVTLLCNVSLAEPAANQFRTINPEMFKDYTFRQILLSKSGISSASEETWERVKELIAVGLETWKENVT